MRKPSIIHSFMICLAIVALLFIPCQNAKAADIPEPTAAPVGGETYTNQTYGFSLVLPLGWTQSDELQYADRVIFTWKDAQSQTLSVIVENADTAQQDIQTLMDAREPDMTGARISSKEIILDGQKGFERIYQITGGYQVLQATMFRGKVFALALSTLKTPATPDNFTQIAGSFKWLEGDYTAAVPQSQVLAEGQAISTPAAAPALQFPFCGTWQITQGYNRQPNNRITQYALDWQHVPAPTLGVALFASHNGNFYLTAADATYGNLAKVVSNTDPSWVTWYAHLSSFNPALVNGDYITAGTFIGNAGNTPALADAKLLFALVDEGHGWWTSFLPEPMSGATGFISDQQHTRDCTPPAPTGLSANPVSQTQIDLGWTATTSDEDGFVIERSLNGTDWTTVTTTTGGVVTYSDTGLTCGTQYSYRARTHYTLYGDSAPSNVVTLSTQACPCYALTLTHTGSGTDPVATPANSAACPAGQYNAGASIALSSTPDTGWYVSSWVGTINDASTAVINTVTMPAGVHTATVNYTQNCYALTLTHTGNGTTPTALPLNSVGCSAGEYHYNESIALTATPDTDWSVSDWTGTTNDSSSAVTNTVTMPNGASTASVNYVQNCYALTPAHSGEGTDPVAVPANSTGCHPYYYHTGEAIALTATPVAGWHVGSWTGTDDDAATTTTNTVTMPMANRTVTVTYTQTCYTLTVGHTGQGSDPTATPTNSTGCAAGQFHAGEVISLFAVPTADWQVGGWTGTSNDASTASTNQVTMPLSAHTVSVSYIEVCYVLTRAHTGQGNDPVAAPTNSTNCAAGLYHSGEAINFTASPAAGWQVGSWNGTVNDASTTVTNAVTMPSNDLTVTVNYIQTCYTLTVQHTGNGSDPVAAPTNSTSCAAGQYHGGETITFTATPDDGWSVSGWSGTTNDASTAVTNTASMPNADHTVGVTYIETPLVCYTLTLNHVGQGIDPVPTPLHSTGCAQGQYLASAVVSLAATPANGYYIGGWSGSDNDNSLVSPNTITMPAANHTVGVIYVRPGDSNVDQQLNAGDLSSLALEIFDGDGNLAADTRGGTYLGNPIGSDANEDDLVDSGDLSCTVIMIFGGTCEKVQVGISAEKEQPMISVDSVLEVERGKVLPLNVSLDSSGEELSSLAFSLKFDPKVISIAMNVPQTLDVSEVIRHNLPEGYTVKAVMDNKEDGKVNIIIYALKQDISPLPDGSLMTINLRTAEVAEPGIKTAIDFSSEPSVSFGSVHGYSVTGQSKGGSIVCK